MKSCEYDSGDEEEEKARHDTKVKNSIEGEENKDQVNPLD